MKPNFTQKQKDQLCYIIGNWYIDWKEKIINQFSEYHRLEQACYRLILYIERLMYFKELLITEDQFNFVQSQIEKWFEITKDNLVECYEDKTHRFGFFKESLKIMVCDDFIENIYKFEFDLNKTIL